MATVAAVFGRIFIAAYFIVTGAFMAVAPGAFEGVLTGAGFVPGAALPTGVVVALCGLLLAVGALTRLMALVLAAWTAFTIALFHPTVILGVPASGVLLQVALLGGLLLVFAHGQMWWSWDAMRRDRRAARLALDGERRAHDADVRAAQADAAATVAETPPLRRRWF